MDAQTRDRIEREIDKYRTNKQLEGRGLEDDPEWVRKLQALLEEGD